MAQIHEMPFDPFDPFASQRERQREMDKSVRPLNDFEAAFKEGVAAGVIVGGGGDGGGGGGDVSASVAGNTMGGTIPSSPTALSMAAFQSQSSLRREVVHLCSENKAGTTTASGFTFCKGNEVCADCSVPEPRWGVPYLGIFVCIRCAMVYRTLKGACLLE